MRVCSIPSALAMETLQSCAKPSICLHLPSSLSRWFGIDQVSLLHRTPSPVAVSFIAVTMLVRLPGRINANILRVAVTELSIKYIPYNTSSCGSSNKVYMGQFYFTSWLPLPSVSFGSLLLDRVHPKSGHVIIPRFICCVTVDHLICVWKSNHFT